MRAALLALVPVLLLAGCTAQVDSAKQQVETVKENLAQAEQALQAARQEATEARDRLDRVRSMEVLREERVTLTLVPVFEQGNLTFRVGNATRSNGEQIAVENLTRLPTLLLSFEGAEFACEPLTCRLRVEEGDVIQVAFEAKPLKLYEVVAAAKTTPLLTLEDAPVLATTSAGDATD